MEAGVHPCIRACVRHTIHAAALEKPPRGLHKELGAAAEGILHQEVALLGASQALVFPGGSWEQAETGRAPTLLDPFFLGLFN